MSNKTATSAPMLVKKLSSAATLPSRCSPQAAGYDLASAKDTIVPARGRALVPTDIACVLPIGTYGRIAPRSSLALKHGIHVGAGVVDPDYRGNIGVVLFNWSDADYNIKVGDRIAQLILETIQTPEIQEVTSLEPTVRGTGGFGSTDATDVKSPRA